MKFGVANVYIDGGYLNKILKELGNGKPIKIQYDQFAISLAKKAGYWCRNIYFYTAPPFQANPPTPEESVRRNRYDKFIAYYKKIPDFNMKEGRVQRLGP
ncbi:MAG: hypothetical protein BJBARM4_0810 [Candidatus Parvarchaeum acidiphilum ARMAN-4]|uniref:NYN domain-containing protein n=2 Tax=Parvarchaeum acidiphilum TaxID=662759 RepID=D2EGB0_PARA4|nr:hypothetical protein [Candidatus Parvarchaeum acidiphilum ARMAN-4]EEZ92613.1 MAG: hypothetical protein BJBARM4_0810 [Candidatus Parvarchaeum acidiphilum ARMAN-4]EGD71804.1 MAG: hypothetical protein CSMARM4_0044 [Candidatus Parvarchaeum acidiphilum ARMAN-4_'5-way FS']